MSLSAMHTSTPREQTHIKKSTSTPLLASTCPNRKVFISCLPNCAMAEPDLKAGLRSLRNSLRQIKVLMAWEQLKQSEARPGQPPLFTFNDFIETDLRNEYSFFLSMSVQIHSILNSDSPAVQEAEHQSIKRQLFKIEQEAYGLNLNKRFYRY